MESGMTNWVIYNLLSSPDEPCLSYCALWSCQIWTNKAFWGRFRSRFNPFLMRVGMIMKNSTVNNDNMNITSPYHQLTYSKYQVVIFFASGIQLTAQCLGYSVSVSTFWFHQSICINYLGNWLFWYKAKSIEKTQNCYTERNVGSSLKRKCRFDDILYLTKFRSTSSFDRRGVSINRNASGSFPVEVGDETPQWASMVSNPSSWCSICQRFHISHQMHSLKYDWTYLHKLLKNNVRRYFNSPEIWNNRQMIGHITLTLLVIYRSASITKCRCIYMSIQWPCKVKWTYRLLHLKW